MTRLAIEGLAVDFVGARTAGELNMDQPIGFGSHLKIVFDTSCYLNKQFATFFRYPVIATLLPGVLFLEEVSQCHWIEHPARCFLPVYCLLKAIEHQAA